MIRRWPFVLLLVVAVGVFWWWKEDQDGAARELLSSERYCPHAARLDEALSAAEVNTALNAEEFFAQLGSDVERVEQEAPGRIRDDVTIVVSALRQARDGNAAEVESPRFDEAWIGLAEFQRETCVGGEPGTE